MNDEYDELDESQKRELIRTLANFSQQNFRLLQDLVKWSTTQTGAISYEPQAFKIEKIYRDVVELYNPQIEEKKLSVITSYSIHYTKLYEHYSYLTCTRAKETTTIQPKPVLIIEGILVLSNASLRKLMDIKVFVDCDSDLRLSRVIQRDIVERGP